MNPLVKKYNHKQLTPHTWKVLYHQNAENYVEHDYLKKRSITNEHSSLCF